MPLHRPFFLILRLSPHPYLSALWQTTKQPNARSIISSHNITTLPDLETRTPRQSNIYYLLAGACSGKPCSRTNWTYRRMWTSLLFICQLLSCLSFAFAFCLAFSGLALTGYTKTPQWPASLLARAHAYLEPFFLVILASQFWSSIYLSLYLPLTLSYFHGSLYLVCYHLTSVLLLIRDDTLVQLQDGWRGAGVL